MSTGLYWIRSDLRLRDNPALTEACRTCSTLLIVYVHDEAQKKWPLGAASQWWLHHSLQDLQKQLARKKQQLIIASGNTEKIIADLCKAHQVEKVFWNRCYEPEERQRAKTVRARLEKQDIQCKSFNGSLFAEPRSVLNKSGQPYKVYTAFWKNFSQQVAIPGLLPAPKKLPPPPGKLATDSVDKLQLLPSINWYSDFKKNWQPGESHAFKAYERRLITISNSYADSRDLPATDGTSRLSPYLRFGEISPWRLWHTLVALQDESPVLSKHIEVIQKQLVWREFAWHLLYHFPETTDHSMNAQFEKFPWKKNYHKTLQQWQQGQTGIPIVDAGMRQLWQTGWMHNRVRMIVASFLTKNLMIHWIHGAKWFWDTLVDADLANNTMGWQWVAGCGVDAAPYFRIFNPVTQAQRFDPDAGYIKRWVPELHVGDYPEPMVDLKTSRQAALDAYQSIRRAK